MTVALPLFEAMVPAQTPLRQSPASPRTRLVCIEMVHGSAGATGEGTAKHYWSTATVEPLAPLREYIAIISGTDSRQADAFVPSEGGADHFRSSAVFLTATHPKQTPGPDVFNGTSIDQIYAQRFCRDTPLPSIQLGLPHRSASDDCQSPGGLREALPRGPPTQRQHPRCDHTPDDASQKPAWPR